MVGRAMRLVLYLGWPCALALVVGLAGLQFDPGNFMPGRRFSTKVYGKYEALSICVQSITGEHRDASAARDLLESSLDTVRVSGPRQFSFPAVVDVGCPGESAHYGRDAKSRRVASRSGRGPRQPSPYHLHIYLMPRTSLQMLKLEPSLADRRVVVEEYSIEGVDANAVMNGVTFGLYATIDELGDDADLHQFFHQALHMQSQLGAPPRIRS